MPRGRAGSSGPRRRSGPGAPRCHILWHLTPSLPPRCHILWHLTPSLLPRCHIFQPHTLPRCHILWHLGTQHPEDPVGGLQGHEQGGGVGTGQGQAALGTGDRVCRDGGAAVRTASRVGVPDHDSTLLAPSRPPPVNNRSDRLSTPPQGGGLGGRTWVWGLPGPPAMGGGAGAHSRRRHHRPATREAPARGRADADRGCSHGADDRGWGTLGTRAHTRTFISVLSNPPALCPRSRVPAGEYGQCPDGAAGEPPRSPTSSRHPEDAMSDYPYAERFPVIRGLPESGRPRDDVLAELADDGRRGGRLLGDRQDLRDDVLRRPRALRLPDRGLRQVRPRQRPAARHVPLGDEVRGRGDRDGPRPDARIGGRRRRAGRHGHHRGHRQHPARAARLPRACRPASAGSPGPTSSSPRPAIRPSTRAATCSASSAARSRSTPTAPWSTSTAMAAAIDENTIAILGSAGNYPYGTIDPIAELGELALAQGRGRCTSTAAWAASSCRSARSWATPSRRSTSGVPGVTSISADTHKYGYAFKGVLGAGLPRQGAAQRRSTSTSSAGRAASTCRRAWRGRRSGGLLAATWAAMVHLGRDGLPRRTPATSSAPRPR